MMSSAAAVAMPAEMRAAPSGDRPVDLVHLSRQTFGDKRLETELLRLFMRQARQIQSGLEAEVGDDAVSSLPAAELLHTLLGSARVVGAHRVALLAESYGAALRGPGRTALSDDERVSLRREVEATCGYIGDLLEAA